MRVALYTRVSTDEQAKKGYSLEGQLRDLRAHAAREGWEVVAEIEDDGYSGSTPYRPGIARLLELAERGEIDAALAVKRDRWFRSRLYRLEMDRDLKEYGVELLALNDTGHKIGDGVSDDFAEWEREIITERLLGGRLNKARKGRVIPGIMAPYGLRLSAERDHFEPNPATMPTVRRIFSEVAGGASLRGVGRRLESEGVPSPTGLARWTPYSVKRLLLQDAYRVFPRPELTGLVDEGLLAREVFDGLDPSQPHGVWWYGRDETVRTRRGRKTKRRPRSDWIAVPVALGPHGVEAALADAARAAVEHNVRPAKVGDEVWPLTGGPLLCDCGRRMRVKRVRSKGSAYFYFVCVSYWGSSERCPHVKFHPAASVDGRVEAFALSLVRDPGALRERVEAEAEEERKRLRRGGDEARALRGELERLDKRRRGHLGQQAEGLIPMSELRELLAALDAERSRVEERLRRVGDGESRLRELEELPLLVESYLRDVPHLVGDEHLVREYETAPDARTPENPLGRYRLAPGRIRPLPDGELARREQEARNERALRLRSLYEALGLTVVASRDGELRATVFSGVNIVERSL